MMERERQQNDSLVNGYRQATTALYQRSWPAVLCSAQAQMAALEQASVDRLSAVEFRLRGRSNRRPFLHSGHGGVLRVSWCVLFAWEGEGVGESFLTRSVLRVIQCDGAGAGADTDGRAALGESERRGDDARPAAG